MKKIAITSLICIIFVLGIIQNVFTQNPKEIHTFNLQVFLEGPFNGSDMNTSIFDSGLLPSNQPYNIEPWNYFGGETLNVNTGDNVVDWILVEFLESLYGPASATPDKIIHREAALLMSDGSILQTDGLNPLEFEADIQYYLYVIIRHRNHLAVLSANSVIPTKGNYSYTFTDELSKAYLDGQKEIAPGVFGMAGGDCDANGIIENTDKDLCWTVKAGNKGYLPGDWNLNTQVNNPDKDDFWVVNLGMESMVPRAFECGDVLIDFRDDQTYNTVLIGDQCWMAENLNIGVYTESFTGGSHSDVSNNGTIEKYCYDNNTNNCDIDGGLYDWDEMMEYTLDTATQGICPDGWHVPTNFEWKILEGTVDGQFGVGHPEWDNEGFRGSDAGLNLKSETRWSNNGNGTDAFGFTVLPTGQRRNIGDFVGIDELATFWTSSPYPSTSWSWRRYLQYDHEDISNGAYYRERGISVRCLKNNQPPDVPSNPTPQNGAINQPVNTTLSWTCTDPENDPLTYDVYFGTETDPPLLDEGISDPFYDPGMLNYGITYYWKIIAHDDHGNLTTGPIWNFSTEFTCGDPLFDLRDEQTYNTILIGDQCWMAENLNIGNFLPGSVMQSNNSEIEKYCYGNDLNTCLTYGGLYQWNEMMQYSLIPSVQGICPTGWHIGSMNEWQTLTNFLGGTGVAGDKMKESGYVHWNPPNTGTNESGFTALPGGNKFYGTGAFMDLYYYCYFWTSENYSSFYAYSLKLSYNNPNVTYSWDNKNYGYSVRCMKD